MSGKWNILQKLGLVLILASSMILIGSELLAGYQRKAVEKFTEQIQSCIPDRSEGDPENYSDAAMPVLQFEGEDISGLIEFPDYGISLPVGSHWEASGTTRYPRRFWGSAYDHSLILGGSSRKGQFDVCGRMDLGDKVVFTDMTGARFTYEVARIDRRKHADMDTFQETDSDLILFARDNSSMDYIIVRCTFS